MRCCGYMTERAMGGGDLGGGGETPIVKTTLIL